MISRAFLTVALFAAVSACSPHKPKNDAPPAPKATEITETGWADADTAEAVSIVYRETNGAADFTLSCIGAAKLLRVEGAMPLAPEPEAGERARLLLGPVEVQGPAQVADAGADNALVSLETPLTPQVLVAIGDAKTARLSYRDSGADTGVDEGGRLAAFAQRCAQRSGIAPAL